METLLLLSLNSTLGTVYSDPDDAVDGTMDVPWYIWLYGSDELELPIDLDLERRFVGGLYSLSLDSCR